MAFDHIFRFENQSIPPSTDGKAVWKRIYAERYHRKILRIFSAQLGFFPLHAGRLQPGGEKSPQWGRQIFSRTADLQGGIEKKTASSLAGEADEPAN
jgi:hypothetical protein